MTHGSVVPPLMGGGATKRWYSPEAVVQPRSGSVRPVRYSGLWSGPPKSGLEKSGLE